MRCALSLRVLGLATGPLFRAAAFTPLPNVLARAGSASPRLEPAEGIVVLGAEIQPDGALTNSSIRRALQGIVLYRRGLAKLLVFSGPPRDGGNAESAVRADLARELGVSPEVILGDEEARTTRQEASRVKGLLQPRGVRRILLVTDSQHMPRAQGLFERAGSEVLAAEADDFSKAAIEPEERLRLMRRIVGELLGRLYYRMAGYL